MSEEFAIRLENVTKQFPPDSIAAGGLKDFLLHLPRVMKAWRERRPFRALEELSLEVRRGECVGVIGRNGSGKSTTLGLIAGVLRPNRGRVETRGRICPLLELGAGFHPYLSGRENILLNGVLLGLTRAEVMARMDEIVAFSELGDFIHRQVRVYSSGMLTRLGFSVAVHVNPDILLIDEVLSVGDEGFQKKCMARMQQFRAKQVTMVFVTHSLQDVEATCDRVALLEAGRLVALGPPKEVVEEYHRRLATRKG